MGRSSSEEIVTYKKIKKMQINITAISFLTDSDVLLPCTLYLVTSLVSSFPAIAA